MKKIGALEAVNRLKDFQKRYAEIEKLKCKCSGIVLQIEGCSCGKLSAEREFMKDLVKEIKDYSL
jgi:hypothetical protein